MIKLSSERRGRSRLFLLDRGGYRDERDEYAGRVVRIHGNRYTFQRRLGSGGFGNA